MSETDALQPIRAELEQRLAAGQLDLPLLPVVAQRTIDLAHDPNADARQLAQLLAGDQALAGRVIRIANSALYAPSGTQLVSLQQAIARLGMVLVAEIALAAAVGGRLFQAPGYDDYLQQIRRYAVATALWAREIARQVRRNVEAAFLCGLLVDLGRPSTLQSVLDIAKKHGQIVPRTSTLALVEQFERVVGRALAERWAMPALVVAAIAQVDDYHAAEAGQDLAMTVNAARRFAQFSLEPEQHTQESLREAAVMADLNLYPDDLDALLARQANVNTTLAELVQ